MAERVPRDLKVPSLNPYLDPTRHASKSNMFEITLVTDDHGFMGRSIPLVHWLLFFRVRIELKILQIMRLAQYH